MLALTPRNGDYSGAALDMRFIAYLPVATMGVAEVRLVLEEALVGEVFVQGWPMEAEGGTRKVGALSCRGITERKVVRKTLTRLASVCCFKPNG